MRSKALPEENDFNTVPSTTSSLNNLRSVVESDSGLRDILDAEDGKELTSIKISA
jgi:hypothetical protein